jgi:putative transposase
VCSLSLRDIELPLAERSVVVSHETVRRWCLKFGQTFARPTETSAAAAWEHWYLGVVFIRIRGVQYYLRRTVDQDGVVLDILVHPRQDANAVKLLFRRFLKGLQYMPRVIVTDKLRSYGVAQRRLLPKVERRLSRCGLKGSGSISVQIPLEKWHHPVTK